MYPSQELQHENYLEWKQYLMRFPFEWSVTLTLDSKVIADKWFKVRGQLNPLNAEKINYYAGMGLFKKWRLNLVDMEKLRVGGYLISSYKQGYLHFHLLLLAHNRRGKTLADCKKRYWERRWPYHARIKDVYNLPGACDYFAIHCKGFRSDHYEIDSFDGKLLKQMMTPKRDGLDNMDGLMSS